MAVIKVSLFAEQERETKLDKIGDALSKLAAHVDFAALATEIDEAAPRPGRERGGQPAPPVFADGGGATAVLKPEMGLRRPPTATPQVTEAAKLPVSNLQRNALA